MLSFQEIITGTEIGLIYGIMAIGIYLTFRTINFPDLTCDGSFVFGASVSSVMVKVGCDPYIALLASMVAGGLAGFCTGAINVWLKIEDLLAGIIVAFMLYSVNLRIMDMNPSITFVDKFTIFSNGVTLGKIAFVVLLLVVLFAYLLNTDFGLGLRSAGQNKSFASACGVNVNTMTITGLVASNALIGMCGAIFSQYQGFCDVSQGAGSLVVGLASVIIGESMLGLLISGSLFRNATAKSGNVAWAVFACVIGSIVYRISTALAIHSDILGLKTQDLNLITGLMIIAIMVNRKCYK